MYVNDNVRSRCSIRTSLGQVALRTPQSWVGSFFRENWVGQVKGVVVLQQSTSGIAFPPHGGLFVLTPL